MGNGLGGLLIEAAEEHSHRFSAAGCWKQTGHKNRNRNPRTGTLQPWNLRTLEACNPGTLEPWKLATLEPWNHATWDCGNPQTLQPSWNLGIWKFGNPATLELWNPAILELELWNTGTLATLEMWNLATLSPSPVAVVFSGLC